MPVRAVAGRRDRRACARRHDRSRRRRWRGSRRRSTVGAGSTRSGSPVSGRSGSIRDAANYGHITATTKPGWADTDVAGRLQRRYGVPTGFHTDVVGAALAEGEWGAAKGLGDHRLCHHRHRDRRRADRGRQAGRRDDASGTGPCPPGADGGRRLAGHLQFPRRLRRGASLGPGDQGARRGSAPTRSPSIRRSGRKSRIRSRNCATRSC